MAEQAAAAAAKAKGNAALSAKNFEEAVAAYTEAIGHDATDKVFYSNRSAAYASMNKWTEALADGKKCIEVDPSFSKGYGRAGAGYFGLGQYEEAVKVYEEGLKVDGNSAVLKEGLAGAKAKLEAASNPIAQLFSDPMNLQKLATNPQTAPFLSQPDFIQKIQQIAQNPSLMQMHMQDPRIQTALSVMLGMGAPPGGPTGEGSEEAGSEPSAPAPAPPPAQAPAPPPVELTEEEKAHAEVAKKAEAVKKLGAALFSEAGKLKKDPVAKKAKVEEAKLKFEEALAINPIEMAYLSNIAACLFELKQHDECIDMCNKALEVGKEYRVDFTMLAKAHARIANCYVAKDMLEEAIVSFDNSLMESHDDKVYDKKMAIKKKKKKQERDAFMDPAKAQECKEKGNDSFKEGDFHTALKHYSEAIDRDPKNHLLYSNRVAALTKIGQMPAALEDCDRCIALCPTFAKIYNRKGNIQFFLKEFHKCTDTFQKVIDLEPESRDATEAREMIMKTQYAVRANQSGPVDAQQQQRAMQDPEIQGILADPVIRTVLGQLGAGGQEDAEGQRQAQEAMKDPSVAKKIEKLMAAGVLKTG